MREVRCCEVAHFHFFLGGGRHLSHFSYLSYLSYFSHLIDLSPDIIRP